MRTLIVCSVLAIAGIFIGAVIGDKVFELNKSIAEANRSWTLLDSPVKFTQIVATEHYTVWAQTADGKFYYWSTECTSQQKCEEWIGVETVENTYTWDEKNNTCSFSKYIFYQPSKEPPGYAAECVQSLNKYYVLLDDGAIWYWETPLPIEGPSVIHLIFMSIGFLLGIIVGLRTGKKL